MALPQTLAGVVTRLRNRRPLVDVLSNMVAADITANVLLAAGASPAMVHALEEVGEFVTVADAVCINIGTLRQAHVPGMHAAADAANRHGKPWVLDPVAVGATTLRTSVASELAEAGPTVVRANASEVMALAAVSGAQPKGVDAANTSAEALPAAKALAHQTGGVVAVTGESDFVTDGARVIRLDGGSDMLPLVTGVGCSLSALTAACVAVADQPIVGAATAAAMMKLAGEWAAAKADGPGTLRLHLMDALYQLSPEALAEGARASEPE